MSDKHPFQTGVLMPGQNLTRLEAAERSATVRTQSYAVVLDLTHGESVFRSTTTVRFTATPGASTFIDLIAPTVHSVSLNVGSVRLRERFLHTDPPTPEEQRASREFVGDLLDGSGIDFAAVASAVGVAGTVTSVAARVLGLEAYSRDAVHGLVLGRDDIRAANSHWLATPVSEIEGEPCMHPLRAGVIGAGTLILDEIAARIPSQKILVSETDILDGIALELL